MACAISTPHPRIILVNEKDANNTIDLVVNDQLEIYLPGNPTTGYEWKLNTIDESILKPQADTEYESKTEARRRWRLHFPILSYCNRRSMG
jgi:predicted secreted protein